MRTPMFGKVDLLVHSKFIVSKEYDIKTFGANLFDFPEMRCVIRVDLDSLRRHRSLKWTLNRAMHERPGDQCKIRAGEVFDCLRGRNGNQICRERLLCAKHAMVAFVNRNIDCGREKKIGEGVVGDSGMRPSILAGNRIDAVIQVQYAKLGRGCG